MAANVQEWTVLSMLEWGTGYFKKKDLPDPRLSIEWLLAEVLGVKRLDLYLSFDRPLAKSELNELRSLVKRRAEHEPLQYITGISEFMNTRLKVTPDVLIPRMETEQLVEIILENHSGEENLRVLDIGTGSGCIAIALKMEQPAWEVTAIDISQDALRIAKDNAETNEVEIKFKKGDILKKSEWNFDKPFDLIASNPPYVLPGEKEYLEPQVVEHEPAEALFCENIEWMYERIIKFGRINLHKKGGIYLETHFQHIHNIAGLFSPQKWELEKLDDYNGKPRFITGKKCSSR